MIPRQLKRLENNNEYKQAEPTQTDFGFIAIISDPDGRKLEI